MVDVQLTRGALIGGTAHAAGEVLSLAPLEASQVIAACRARLVDPADVRVIAAAEAAHTARICSAGGHQFAGRLAHPT